MLWIDFVDSTYRAQGCARDVYTKKSNPSVWVHTSIFTPISQSMCSFIYPSIKIVCDLLSVQLPVSLDIKISSKLRIGGSNIDWFFLTEQCVCQEAAERPQDYKEVIKMRVLHGAGSLAMWAWLWLCSRQMADHYNFVSPNYVKLRTSRSNSDI